MVTDHHRQHLLDLRCAWKELAICQRQTQCDGRLPPPLAFILWLVFLLPKMEMEVEVQGKTRSRIIKPNEGRGFYITLEQEE